MKLQKWNKDKKEYEEFDSPARFCPVHLEDMDRIIDCANCGRQLQFGDCFTSRLIHTDGGFGYPVCSTCYFKENK